MRNRTAPFTLAVVAAAVAATMFLRTDAAPIGSDHTTAILILCSFALVADLMLFLLPHGAMGSIAFIPNLCAILVVPSWYTVAGMAIQKAIAESARRAEPEKAIFNIGQHALSASLAILVYINMGGHGFIDLNARSVAQLSRENGFAAFAAFITFFTANTLLVSTVIALSTRARVLSVWKAQHLATIGIDIIASPLIFVFAWVYVQFGAIVAATAWVPMIGIRQLHKTNLELERTNEELLELMIKSIEARDPYTSGHSRRVQHYSTVIARTIGLPEKEVVSVGRAALLHDVGKIHEKYGPILRKAERLSPDEWDTMRQHPLDGANLVATMSRLRELVAPVRHHHENWDGTGYPDGLTGELIPLPARIIRFADTIDAMTTERPYRPAMSTDEVRGEIVRCRGTQFDPHLVDRLLSSPTWRTMFAPVAAGPTKFGALAVVSSKPAPSKSARA